MLCCIMVLLQPSRFRCKHTVWCDGGVCDAQQLCHYMSHLCECRVLLGCPNALHVPIN